jgi:dynein heavy chain
MSGFRKDWTHDELFEGGNFILFADFLKPDLEQHERAYEELSDLTRFSAVAKRYLEDYNDYASSPMNLVFFNDALEHLCRICRILRLPRGNAMLIGVGGSGKQSLTRLASSINFAQCFQIQVSKTYNFTSFREDVKKVFVMCGGPEAAPTVFLFTDTQISQESFLEDINNILNSGEVPNLFAKEELEAIE